MLYHPLPTFPKQSKNASFTEPVHCSLIATDALFSVSFCAVSNSSTRCGLLNVVAKSGTFAHLTHSFTIRRVHSITSGFVSAVRNVNSDACAAYEYPAASSIARTPHNGAAARGLGACRCTGGSRRRSASPSIASAFASTRELPPTPPSGSARRSRSIVIRARFARLSLVPTPFAPCTSASSNASLHIARAYSSLASLTSVSAVAAWLRAPGVFSESSVILAVDAAFNAGTSSVGITSKNSSYSSLRTAARRASYAAMRRFAYALGSSELKHKSTRGIPRMSFLFLSRTTS
eukprot:31278-Pelagococcus_subviridis.AAC.9